MKTMAPLIV